VHPQLPVWTKHDPDIINQLGEDLFCHIVLHGLVGQQLDVSSFSP
jgi:hypothetical protein